MRHTKIVATLGPASNADPVLEHLVSGGVDIARLNFSHGTIDSHRTILARVRAAAERQGRHVGILQDLGGPKIRTGRLEGGRAVVVKPGDRLRLATGDGIGNQERIYTAFGGLAAGVRVGDRLLIDDGHIELSVEGTDGREIESTVLFGGAIAEHKGINAPGVRLPTSALTPKDVKDLEAGLEMGVDLVALSFVQTPEDLEAARAIMSKAGRPDVPLIAKIERPQAVEQIERILDRCDGIMVARGDLGLELPLERVPRIQKQVTEAAMRRGLPVIVATQVLDSMRTEPRPTRAEVSDAAHAVEDGVDAIMLAGETAVGIDPAHVVRTLALIIEEAEAATLPVAVPELRASDGDTVWALCRAAVTLAERGHAQAIIALTRSGRTARMLSALRPSARVTAVTATAAVARRLALSWGVVPMVVELPEEHLPLSALVQKLRQDGVVAPGAAAVLVSVDPDLARADANFLKLVVC